MKFCTRCHTVIHAKEDRRARKLYFSCRVCSLTADLVGSRISSRQITSLHFRSAPKEHPSLDPSVKKQISNMHFECDPSITRLCEKDNCHCAACGASGSDILFFNAQEYLIQLNPDENIIMVCMCMHCRNVFQPSPELLRVINHSGEVAEEEDRVPGGKKRTLVQRCEREEVVATKFLRPLDKDILAFSRAHCELDGPNMA
jgi:DNA-directed RNA polymerase subunit M/transcription elongation factor TFIIS